MNVLVFANGSLVETEDIEDLASTADMIIAVDGGANHCARLNLTPTFLIGDLDSIDKEILRKYQQTKTTIQKYSEKKDATDLELALDFATAKGASTIHLCASLGKRWDMSLANIQLCASKKYKACAITLLGDDCYLKILHPGPAHILNGKVGRTISLLPLTDAAVGVTLKGFEYPLQSHTLTFGSSLGVSNVIAASPATISFNEGILLYTELINEVREKIDRIC